MTPGQAAELFIFIFCILLLLFYNILYFSQRFQRMRITFRGRTFLNLWSVGSEARAIWAQSMMLDPKEGITGAQTIRNMVMGCSILAAAIAVLAGQLILLVTDGSRLDQISSYSYLDPISGEDYLLDPVVKIAICLGVLFSSLILLMQCVRLSVHLTFLLRAVSTDPSRHRRLQKLAFAINRRASLYFSLGLRVQYSFFPLFLYILGPLALLISTIVELSALFLMDLTPDDILYSYKEEEEESRVEVSSLSGFGPRECLPEDSGRIEQPNYQPARNIHNDKAAYPIRDTA